MTKKYFYNTLPLVLLILAIGLSPRISLGTIEGGRSLDIRIEDIVLFLLGLFWLAKFLASGEKKFQKPPLFFPIIAWLGIGLFSVLINLVFMNLMVSRAFFYFLKEIEYFFLFFYVFFHIKNINSAKIVLKFWMFVVSVDIAWILFELISGLQITYYYGPTPFIEPKGTFPAGGFFLVIFTFLLNVFLYYYLNLNISYFKKIIIYIFTVMPVVGVLSSGSRSSFAGLVATICATFLLYTLTKKKFIKACFILLFIVVFISIIFSFSKSLVLDRFFNLQEIKGNLNPEFSLSRPGIWLQQLREAANHPLFLFFGFGKSAIVGGLGESHSQYLRNFIETGIIGSFLFLLLLYSILKKSWMAFLLSQDHFLTGVSAGLFVSTLAMMVMSLFAEGFLVVKINEAYWFFAALTFAVLFASQNSKIIEESR